MYAVLLALSTVTHQPDPSSDFDAYARYVTTDVFLASHLVASIIGAGIGLVGVVAVLAFLADGPASRQAAWGTALTIVGTVVTASVFGAAAYAQPAIGQAHFDDVDAAVAFDDAVYGTPLVAMAVLGLLLLVVGSALLGMAIAPSRPDLRWAGWTYAAAMFVFAVPGFVLGILQPVAGAVLAIAAVAIAHRLPRSRHSAA